MKNRNSPGESLYTLWIDTGNTCAYHGGMKQPRQSTRTRCSYRLGPSTVALLKSLQAHLGIGATAIVELSVHYLAHANGLSAPPNHDAPEPRALRNGGKAK